MSNTYKPVRLMLAIASILMIIPWMPLNPYIHHVTILILLFAYLATAWNMLGGYAGQVSLGHAAFFGLGAYFTYFFLKWFNITPLVGMFMASAVSVAAAAAIGVVAFRFGLRGVYFVLATLAFAEILRELFIAFREITGGSLGVSYPVIGYSPLYFQFPERWPYYYFILSLWIITILTMYILRGFFTKLVAIRENEEVAASIGIDVPRYKLIALLLSSFFTSLGGAFYLQYYRYIDPNTVFGLELSIDIAVMAIFGGMYSIWGPSIGALILVPTSEILRITLGGGYYGAYLIIYGMLLILILKLMPRGIYDKLYKIIYERTKVKKEIVR
ncbi:MAG: branched-chain amino acid ABC transporter permease [Sulfolobales archaeon]